MSARSQASSPLGKPSPKLANASPSKPAVALQLPQGPSSHLWGAKESVVVRSRQGSVLTRGLILKADHFAGARRPHLGLHLQGAPNFRKAEGDVEVYGCAQPTVAGLKGVLSVLQCRPQSQQRAHTSLPMSASKSAPISAGRKSFDGRALSSGLDGGRSTPLASQQPFAGADGSLAVPGDSTPGASSPPLSPGLDRSFEDTSDAMENARRCVWICTREEPVLYIGGSRPFVLRDWNSPTETFSLSDRADNLEAIENRLKQDCLREAARYGGLLMVHEEDEEGRLHPSWVAVDGDNCKTVKEVFAGVRREGWSVDFHRIPISPDQGIENNYLDAYTRVLKELDPARTSVVANCGVGAVRTTVAMCAASIVRRRQIMLSGYADPLRVSGLSSGQDGVNGANGRRGSTPNAGLARSLKAATDQQENSQSLLRLLKVLTPALAAVGTPSHAAVELLMNRPALLDALLSANVGNYGIIRQLCALLERGLDSKQVADHAIDACSAVVHIRESILAERVAYALAAADSEGGSELSRPKTAAGNSHLRRAVRSLEQYASLVIFAEYVAGSETGAFTHRFAAYLKNRAEVWRTIERIRHKGTQLFVFDPLSDLSALSRRSKAHKVVGQLMGGDASGVEAFANPSVPGDEFAEHVVSRRAGIVLRPGMLLKIDQWHLAQASTSLAIRGSVNFRRIADSSIFATGQPTADAIIGIVRSIQDQLQGSALTAKGRTLRVTWLSVREEPIIYVNRSPVVLRQKGMSLRNIKAYSGITAERLCLIEDRLKSDCLQEIEDNEGKLLLHAETDDGQVVPRWEDTQPADVETVESIMEHVSQQLAMAGSDPVTFSYHRITLTPERPPDLSDFDDLFRAVLKADVGENALLTQDQLGRGRATLAAIIVLLVAQWRESRLLGGADAGTASPPSEDAAKRPDNLSYQSTNALIRVIPRGLQVKDRVDGAIEACSTSVFHLLRSVEESRLAAEDIDDPESPLRREKIHSGIHSLHKYFLLLIFQAYLDSLSKPDGFTFDDVPTFERFVKGQPVFQSLAKDFDRVEMQTITPLQSKNLGAAEGMALTEEVQDVLTNRTGSVLGAYTMLKSDFFPGLAKIHLSQVEGIPNLRGISLSARPAPGPPSTPSRAGSALASASRMVWGHGMPTVEGLRRGYNQIGAGPGGHVRVVASGLREEPVLFVNGRPFCFRLADKPIANVETTGITAESVENTESSLKADVIAEAHRYGGRVLLHDEKELANGRFSIIPLWEHVNDEDILTPREVYEMVQKEGFRVEYQRIPWTDEQAPVPTVFSQIEERALLALRTDSAFVCNCQMGRGRTTTGMVVASLVATVAQHGEELLYTDMGASFVSSGPDADGQALIDNAKDAMDSREDELRLQGEWRSVLRLVGVLSHGKLAKRLVDQAVDSVAHVQNIRTAIYDAKLRADNAEPGTKKHRHLETVFTNYLQRYGYLIVFASYLLEKAASLAEGGGAGGAGGALDDDDDGGRSVASLTSNSFTAAGGTRFPTFVAWLQPRREIQNIFAQKNLE